MGFFSFRQEIAVDLGTANTIIIHKDKIVIDEPSVVAQDAKTGKMIAVGEKAREMHGKVHEGIRTIRLWLYVFLQALLKWKFAPFATQASMLAAVRYI